MHPTVDTRWRDQALCAQTDPEIFFPEVGQNAIAARRGCAACPARDACLADALARGDQEYGVLGGTTARDRRDHLAGSRRTRAGAAA
jgi:WhiB family redox-sensing transcriptional regulator